MFGAKLRAVEKKSKAYVYTKESSICIRFEEGFFVEYHGRCFCDARMAKLF